VPVREYLDQERGSMVVLERNTMEIVHVSGRKKGG